MHFYGTSVDNGLIENIDFIGSYTHFSLVKYYRTVFGNIDPQSRGFKKDSYLQKQMNFLTESEEHLTKNLSDEEQKAFLIILEGVLFVYR